MSLENRDQQHQKHELRRIPGLDGLRAVSISFVLLAHLSGTAGFPLSGAKFEALGALGVRVFFVISGFLITTLLAGEHVRTGSVSIARFYLRRALRLFPAAFLLIGVTALLGSRGVLDLKSGDILHALTYTMNFHFSRGWALGHLWSLAVEEQFYLLWPLAIVIFGLSSGKRMLAATVLVCPLLRIAVWAYSPTLSRYSGEMFFTIADAIAAGCLLALYRTSLHKQKLYLRVLQHPAFALVPLLAVVLAYNPFAFVDWLFGQTIQNICIALAVDYSVTNTAGFVARVLNSRVFVVVGLLSYSLYLWQQPFLNRHSSAWYSAFPTNVALAFAVATASYFLVEKPGLRFRTWLEHRLYVPARPEPKVAAAAAAEP